MLKAKILQRREMERMAELKSMYDNKGQIAWGNQLRSYVLAPYQLVKDHRTSHEAGQSRTRARRRSDALSSTPICVSEPS
jgi:peptide chain release factor 2